MTPIERLLTYTTMIVACILCFVVILGTGVMASTVILKFAFSQEVMGWNPYLTYLIGWLAAFAIMAALPIGFIVTKEVYTGMGRKFGVLRESEIYGDDFKR